MNAGIPNTRKVAFVIDGQVIEIISTEDRLAAILLSGPITIDVTGQTVEEGGSVSMGTEYNYSTGRLYRTMQVDINAGVQSQINQPTEPINNTIVYNDLPIFNGSPTPVVNNPSPCGCK